jgi:hypothetical protein
MLSVWDLYSTFDIVAITDDSLELLMKFLWWQIVENTYKFYLNIPVHVNIYKYDEGAKLWGYAGQI